MFCATLPSFAAKIMGVEIDIFWLTVLMFGSLATLLAMGLPLAFVTGGLACVFLFVFGDASALNIIPSRLYPLMTDYQLTAIPMFIFMASMLERAGIIEELFDMVYKMLGGLRGGLASSTVIASTLLAAMCGVIGATEVTMGLIALPAMLKRKYDRTIACGSILAGGTLGILIPPSILAILFAVVAQQSVGELFIGAVIPGIDSVGDVYFIHIHSLRIKSVAGAGAASEERVTASEKLRLLTNLAAPIALVTIVLGVIFTGVATPVEAAGVGSFGAMVVSAMHRRLTVVNIRAAAISTLKVTGMVLWIIFGATLFVGFYIFNDGQEFVNRSILATGLGPYGILILMMVILVVLGMFLDWVGILLLAVPIFIPLMKTLSFGGVFGLPGSPPEELALWFGVVYMVNMQMSFLSPPFGYALFYLKSVAPPDVTMSQIYKSSLPFLFLQAIGLTLCIIFPEFNSLASATRLRMMSRRVAIHWDFGDMFLQILFYLHQAKNRRFAFSCFLARDIPQFQKAIMELMINNQFHTYSFFPQIFLYLQHIAHLIVFRTFPGDSDYRRPQHIACVIIPKTALGVFRIFAKFCGEPVDVVRTSVLDILQALHMNSDLADIKGFFLYIDAKDINLTLPH